MLMALMRRRTGPTPVESLEAVSVRRDGGISANDNNGALRLMRQRWILRKAYIYIYIKS